MATKDPGIALPINSGLSKLFAKSFSNFLAACEQDGEDVVINFSFTMRAKGKLKAASFDPATDPDFANDPNGNNTLYLNFDDPARHEFKQIVIDPTIDIKNTSPGTTPVNLKFNFTKGGKTQWGKTQWGLE